MSDDRVSSLPLHIRRNNQVRQDPTVTRESVSTSSFLTLEQQFDDRAAGLRKIA